MSFRLIQPYYANHQPNVLFLLAELNLPCNVNCKGGFFPIALSESWRRQLLLTNHHRSVTWERCEIAVSGSANVVASIQAKGAFNGLIYAFNEYKFSLPSN